MTTLLELSEVEKRYDNGTLALERVNLKVGQHEFVSLLGWLAERTENSWVKVSCTNWRIHALDPVIYR